MQTPIRSPPPAASTSIASSSKSRPSGPVVPAVFSNRTGQRLRLRQRLADERAGPCDGLLERVLLARAGVEDDAVGADRVAEPECMGQRGQRLLADLPVGAGGVDQVDGVDHRRAERRGRERLLEGGEVIGPEVRRPPCARALVEDLDRLAAALDAALDGVLQPARCGNMGADQHGRFPSSPIRPLANWRAAHRRREDGTVQLARRPGDGRDAGAADRGHRPRALDAGERRADPRRAALARARLGRGADQPVRAGAAPPRAPRGAARSPAPPTATRRPAPRCRNGARRTRAAATGASR